MLKKGRWVCCLKLHLQTCQSFVRRLCVMCHELARPAETLNERFFSGVAGSFAIKTNAWTLIKLQFPRYHSTGIFFWIFYSMYCYFILPIYNRWRTKFFRPNVFLVFFNKTVFSKLFLRPLFSPFKYIKRNKYESISSLKLILW